MSLTPEAIRKLLDELEASRASRKRAWENLQEIRWILTRISHAPLRNAHSVPTSVGVSRESIRPGKLLPKQLATGDFSEIQRICEKVRLKEATGVDLPLAARKTIDLEGRVVKEGVRKIVNDR